MRVWILMALVALVGGYTHLSARAEELDGGVAWEQHCGSCHNFRAPNERSDYDWSIIVAHMRSIASLTGKQQRAIDKFLKENNNTALGTKKSEIAENVGNSKPSSEIGKELVTKKQCLACHMIGGEGGKVGPSLSAVFSRHSDEYVSVQILDPKKNNPTSIMPPYKLSSDEIQSVLMYLRSAK